MASSHYYADSPQFSAASSISIEPNVTGFRCGSGRGWDFPGSGNAVFPAFMFIG